MGGRPTRPILYNTIRKAKIIDECIYMRDKDNYEHSINEHDYNRLR